MSRIDHITDVKTMTAAQPRSATSTKRIYKVHGLHGKHRVKTARVAAAFGQNCLPFEAFGGSTAIGAYNGGNREEGAEF